WSPRSGRYSGGGGCEDTSGASFRLSVRQTDSRQALPRGIAGTDRCRNLRLLEIRRTRRASFIGCIDFRFRRAGDVDRTTDTRRIPSTFEIACIGTRFSALVTFSGVDGSVGGGSRIRKRAYPPE